MAEITEDVAATYARVAAKYRGADTAMALMQLGTTILPLIAAFVLMAELAHFHYALALLCAPFAGGLLVRLFIIQHDCGHRSFVPSRAWNDLIGRALSLITLTPFATWKHEHALHHAGSGNLERRGAGEINLLTVREYLALTPWGRWRYRVYRNMFFMLFLGGPLYFIVLNRLPWFRQLPFTDVWRSVLGLDLMLGLVYWYLISWLGLTTTLILVGPAVYIASVVGIWLFYVQHQFADSQWYHEGEWNQRIAALEGGSYYELPRILQWPTGSIGIHHTHHVNSMIPNYKLPACYAELSHLPHRRLTLRESWACMRLKLWDEEKRRLVGFP